MQVVPVLSFVLSFLSPPLLTVAPIGVLVMNTDVSVVQQVPSRMRIQQGWIMQAMHNTSVSNLQQVPIRMRIRQGWKMQAMHGTNMCFPQPFMFGMQIWQGWNVQTLQCYKPALFCCAQCDAQLLGTQFSATKIGNGLHQRCTKCMVGHHPKSAQHLALQCSSCNVVRPWDWFSKKQWDKGRSKHCKLCVTPWGST